jgi:bleomycin hydrolase
MKKFFFLFVSTGLFAASFAQTNFTVIKNNPATPVKNQANTGTCWSFSTTSLVESQTMKNNWGEFDLSEMFTVRNIYLEKAKNYVLRQGHAQFGEGGLGHDQIRAIEKYGAIPESVYSGLPAGKKSHDHQKLSGDLKKYLDSIIKLTPVPQNWLEGYTDLLNATLGKPPAEFDYNGKMLTPQSFAKNVLHFDANDYVMLTSFTHHPFYEPFILEVPDNFSNGAFYNLPVGELIQVTKDALNKGYTISWDADVSNKGFMPNKGVAEFFDTTGGVSEKNKELDWNATLRQTLFENLTTQDDHLMHITGIEKSADGKDFFIVKNSWGNIGPDKNGYINVSESYFGINTISLVVPKAAISRALLDKLKVK